MDLDSLAQTVKFLKKYSDCEAKVLFLQKLVDEKNAYITSLELKLKAFTDNTQIKSYISSLEEKIKSLQTTIEKLEIVILTKVNDSTVISNSFTKDSLKRTDAETNSLYTIISEKKVWNCIQSYLTSGDIMNLFLTSNAIKAELSQNIRIFAKLLKNLSLPAPMALDKPMEIQGLLKNEHHIEINLKNIEEKLVSVMKPLLIMQKTTDILTSVSMPSEKYSSIEEFIVSRFTIDKTTQLLHRSASFLANNPAKMADWVNFIDSSLAGLLFESSRLLIDCKTLEKIKKDLIEKLQVAEEHLIALEFERKDLIEQLTTETDLKVHLAQRLRKQDLENNKRMSEITKLKESIQQSDIEKIHLSKKIERITSEFEEHRKVMADEIFRLRKQITVANSQKSEYLEAFTEFHQILNALPFD